MVQRDGEQEYSERGKQAGGHRQLYAPVEERRERRYRRQ